MKPVTFRFINQYSGKTVYTETVELRGARKLAQILNNILQRHLIYQETYSIYCTLGDGTHKQIKPGGRRKVFSKELSELFI